jgi:hypothetical protein
MKPLVPSKPGPPKDPKSFWAPWPAIREPCAKRTINGADSFVLEPPDLPAVLAVGIFTPFVAFCGLVDPLARRRSEESYPLVQAVYPRRFE